MNKQPLTVRMDPKSKALFEKAAIEAGLEPGVAGRQVLELFVRMLREGDGYIDAVKKISAQRGISEVRRVMGEEKKCS